MLGRDGSGIPGATVTLLDDHGRETANTRTNPKGARRADGPAPRRLHAGHRGRGLSARRDHGGRHRRPVDAEIALTRSASLAGTVGGEDGGPVVGAQLALVQHGELVDTTQSGPEGAYRFRDLSSGEYGLSVSAHECEPAALVVEIADEADLRQDVDSCLQASRPTT